MIPGVLLPAIEALGIVPQPKVISKTVSAGGSEGGKIQPRNGYAYVMLGLVADSTVPDPSLKLCLRVGNQEWDEIPLVDAVTGKKVSLFYIFTRREPLTWSIENGSGSSATVSVYLELLEVPSENVDKFREYLRKSFERVMRLG